MARLIVRTARELHPVREFYPNVIVVLTVTDWTKHLAMET